VLKSTKRKQLSKEKREEKKEALNKQRIIDEMKSLGGRRGGTNNKRNLGLGQHKQQLTTTL